MGLVIGGNLFLIGGVTLSQPVTSKSGLKQNYRFEWIKSLRGDPGSQWRGVPTPKAGGLDPVIWQLYRQKLHEE